MTILSADQPGAIPDQFIVALCETDELTERGVEDVVRELIARHGGTATHIFNAFRMFALHATTQQALAHAADPAVKYVEQDQFAEPAGIQAERHSR